MFLGSYCFFFFLSLLFFFPPSGSEPPATGVPAVGEGRHLLWQALTGPKYRDSPIPPSSLADGEKLAKGEEGTCRSCSAPCSQSRVEKQPSGSFPKLVSGY